MLAQRDTGKIAAAANVGHPVRNHESVRQLWLGVASQPRLPLPEPGEVRWGTACEVLGTWCTTATIIRQRASFA